MEREKERKERDRNRDRETTHRSDDILIDLTTPSLIVTTQARGRQ